MIFILYVKLLYNMVLFQIIYSTLTMKFIYSICVVNSCFGHIIFFHYYMEVKYI